MVKRFPPGHWTVGAGAVGGLLWEVHRKSAEVEKF